MSKEVFEINGLDASGIEHIVGQRNTERPETYNTVPRYMPENIIPQPIIENGVAVEWIIPLTMTHNGVTHTIYERWECAEEDRFAPYDPAASRLLERIITRLVNDRNFFGRCADELDAKIASLNANQGE